MTALILVVNDDPAQRRQIKSIIEAQDLAVLLADQQQTALELLRRQSDEIKVVLLDLATDGIDYRSFLHAVAEMDLDIPVVVLTGQSAIEQAVEAMRAGAFDFIVNPAPAERIAGAIANGLRYHGRDATGHASRRSRSTHTGFGDIISASGAMARVIDLARRAVSTSIPVILEGEAGVGKELVARAIHFSSDRSGKPFVSLNCGVMPTESISAALFGDGISNPGKLAAAEGGTLYLHEIADLPADAQARLLRFVGGEVDGQPERRARKPDVRLISTTGRDLIEEVKAGRFREDLYYRLNVYPITIQALRKRRDDIPHLARAFVERFSAEQRLPRALNVGPGALALMTAYDWPGNVRQLENAIYRAVVLAGGNDLTEKDFPQIASQVPDMFGATQAARPETAMLGGYAADMPKRSAQSAGTPIDPSTASGADLAPGLLSPRDQARLVAAASNPSVLQENVIVSVDPAGNVRKLSEIEEELIRFALKYYRGQMSQVARKLGIGRSTLYRKLKDYGIDPDDPHKDAA